MYKFLCFIQPAIRLKIYAEFVPSKDYHSRCFRIINIHYLKYISKKEKGKRKKEVKNAN